MVSKRCGLELDRRRAESVEPRLQRLAQNQGAPSLDEWVLKVNIGGNDVVSALLVEELTVNETYFFRDPAIYEYLIKSVIPDRLARSPKVRIWSCPCSTGQEVYTILIALAEKFGRNDDRFSVVASDVSLQALELAKAGSYSDFELSRGMARDMRERYFKNQAGRNCFDAELKKRITFTPYNLITPQASLGKFDVIFCRNVIIYFSNENKKLVLDHVASSLNDDGYLFLGGAESPIGFSDRFQRIEGVNSVYRKVK